MSNFNPPPTDNLDHCGRNGCPSGQACFLYTGGTLCQPYTIPEAYPPTGANPTIVDPPGWYLVNSYPSVRYTGSLVNQTQGANCTTIPVPPNQLFVKLVGLIAQWDLGGIFTNFDQDYSSTLVQFRGNCAENFYCQPSVPTAVKPILYRGQPIDVPGQLPGTCQMLKPENEVCQASNMCIGWHVNSDGTYENDQTRCILQGSNSPNATTGPLGFCKNVNAGRGRVDPNQGSKEVQRTARTYLLSTLLLFLLVILYLWYRRAKHRQREQQRQQATDLNGDDSAYYNENDSDAYLRQGGGGVYRPSDGTDNGELPAYGQHRRDERIVGPAAEEIGMYAFPTQPPPPLTPNSPYGPPPTPPPPISSSSHPYTDSGAAYSSRPVQHSYPFPMTHPQLNTALNHHGHGPSPVSLPTGGALYAPPSSDPPPLTSQQAEAAALSAAIAAAAAATTTTTTTTTPTAAVAGAATIPRSGSPLPPAYEPSSPLNQSSVNGNANGNGNNNGNGIEGATPTIPPNPLSPGAPIGVTMSITETGSETTITATATAAGTTETATKPGTPEEATTLENRDDEKQGRDGVVIVNDDPLSLGGSSSSTAANSPYLPCKKENTALDDDDDGTSTSTSASDSGPGPGPGLASGPSPGSGSGAESIAPARPDSTPKK
ncbi:hypothetical protein BX616_000073 [Lobosporangium transversale]|uniref:Uncharacterized protein n=1 Tax=Lobosporangium transversale TaxID=64571 RepID=A0A1Y2GL05_9FUNG|nr:hypothetical protein BCR41DRAFT_422791 [Lobosporangium transversale]KAF9908610.1 hypothetical protein BX616_000073 [Lobosporangium transversale]ORZ13902.1 hypothetical protein BCR41DRAFT_422791 [Lobosporangium transversale]|eukprot:XP_021880686.1 hypothetical protein BCR41DRAFT_422791 [Lobosporangium transversale]